MENIIRYSIMFYERAFRQVLQQAWKNCDHVIYNPIPALPLVEARQKGISYLGGRSYIKGFEVLMKALKILKEGDLEVYLTKSSEKPRKQKMSNRISVNLLPKINLKDLVSLMSKTSIMVIPQLWPEPLP
ncbi:MAG: hypothetical protein QXR45_09315 [Candidatus Bathyarchaeia archaeon]